jgi:hypothetical protein
MMASSHDLCTVSAAESTTIKLDIAGQTGWTGATPHQEKTFFVFVFTQFPVLASLVRMLVDVFRLVA